LSGAAPRPPAYASGGTLASVLPAVARSLGSSRYASVPDLGFVPARRAVVVLVDGLGYGQLSRRAGHAPFLRAHLPTTRRLDCGFPSTTAASMGTFGTGTPPGRHGLVGMEVLDPAAGRVFNELSWENGPDPFAWQPVPTVFELLANEGVLVTRIGPRFFDGSGLRNEPRHRARQRHQRRRHHHPRVVVARRRDRALRRSRFRSAGGFSLPGRCGKT